MSTNYSPTITVMMKAIRRATRSMIRDFGELEQLQVSRKGTNDFVTAADLKAEKIIIEELQKARPKYGILSEERPEIKGEDESFRWIIDPLDGTINFMHGNACFCSTVALEKTNPNGTREIIACVTESPVLNETYWAEKGAGAWVENNNNRSRRLRVSVRKKFHDALFCVGALKRDIETAQKLVNLEASGVRNIGSTALALAYTAAGNFDAFAQSSAKYWDIAAGILLVKEAGGIATNFQDKHNFPETSSIIAAGDDIHRALIKAL